MKLKVRRIGGSLGVIIPKVVLDEMSVREGDELEMQPQGGSAYSLHPTDSPLEERDWADLADIFAMGPDEQFLRDTEIPGMVSDPWADLDGLGNRE
ncbi:MAG: AbrB/MazE/SpoVT family DNA-binding domain-containing protein [Candidatus Nanopelagicales bacterium]|nr:AbrB/MazE/SpoVT family DNA-binding domain-containing protein [Candidatus Nanopelagicales bacterium]